MRMHGLIKSLIALRRDNAFLTKGEPACELLENGVIRVVWTLDGETVAAALINPNPSAVPAELPDGGWTLIFSGESSSMESVGGKDVLVVTLTHDD